jgi:ankyrin repeat protein
MFKQSLFAIISLFLIFSCVGDQKGVTYEDMDKALIEAIKKEDVNEVKKLLEAGADVNVKNDFDFTALMLAVLKENPDIIRLLLDNGADINEIVDYIGGYCAKTPLMFAIENEKFESAKILIEEGADVNLGSDRRGTPLIIASCKGYKETVELLVKNGADVNARGGYYNATALERALFNHHEEIIQILKDAGAVE